MRDLKDISHLISFERRLWPPNEHENMCFEPIELHSGGGGAGRTKEVAKRRISTMQRSGGKEATAIKKQQIS